jgi:hypothetical protein
MERGDAMKEEWRDIKGYEGRYQISNYGKVKSLKTNREKKAFLQKFGYLKVQLYDGKKARNYFVHRLVAQAFIPNYNNLREINHKDEDKTNNSVTNLEWCDRSYNVKYGKRIDVFRKRMTNHPSVSKVIQCFDFKGNLISTYPSANEASRQTKIPATSIRGCAEGLLTHAGGFKWEYQ